LFGKSKDARISPFYKYFESKIVTATNNIKLIEDSLNNWMFLNISGVLVFVDEFLEELDQMIKVD
jgi:hypothetical protein